MRDKTLRQDIIDEFEFEPSFDGAHVGIAVEDGVVTLTGHVGSYSQKLAAVAAAQRVKGVRGIADEIEVRYPDNPKTDDQQIARRALDLLRWDSTVSQYEITALVSAGWVTLSGTVNWQFERRAAESCIRKLGGVVGVLNHIKLKQRTTSRGVKAKIEAALARHAAVEAGAIRVSVTGGDHVVLEGEVDSWRDRSAAEHAAWSAPGVMSVDDLIVVR
ncbi:MULTISPECIES: BON domain-containing protein [Bradyrhizobium]|uniref:BON domain-containing protein n=1 Tax=Bradyrhizobium elkanii TaxID=29448 RepID=A0A4U6S2V7_BRAEL|nr:MULTISPECIES: BON domain-containing protein [Bradyrhizobium]MTV15455.1 BON domain-containing protein [Bradyrhizobium sp. BR2003]TKV81183.1 BON domain-containing protein [Bradyrhizobium elkanii]